MLSIFRGRVAKSGIFVSVLALTISGQALGTALRDVARLEPLPLLPVTMDRTSESNIVAPEGFVLQRLDATDGLIARPKDWHYTSHGDPAGWTWIIAKEDPGKGPYETGLRIQLLVGIAKGTGKSAEAFAQDFLSGKRQAIQVLSECGPIDLGSFTGRCLEAIETLTIAGATKPYHVRYGAFWGKTMDMAAFTTFGAPADQWESVRRTADTMSAFELIGPDLGKPTSLSAPNSGQ